MLQKVVKLAASCQVTQDPGEDASTRCDSTKLGACTLVISITLSSFSPKLLQRSDPPRPLQNTWTREGLNPQRGGPSCEWFTSARNLRCDRSLPLPQDCPQYIPKGKPTPASKLAFVMKSHWPWDDGINGETLSHPAFWYLNHRGKITISETGDCEVQDCTTSGALNNIAHPQKPWLSRGVAHILVRLGGV